MKEIEKDTDGKIPHVSGLEALTLLYHFILSSILHYNANLHLKLYDHHFACFSKVSFPLGDKLHQGKNLACLVYYCITGMCIFLLKILAFQILVLKSHAWFKKKLLHRQSFKTDKEQTKFLWLTQRQSFKNYILNWVIKAF